MNQLSVETPASLWLRDRCIRIITAAVVLVLLYLGRDVLIPLVLSIMLSLLVAPLVRALRHVGVARTPAVLMAVLALSACSLATAVVLGTQVLHMAESLPKYKATVQRKLETVNAITAGRLTFLTGETSRLFEGEQAGDRTTGLVAEDGASDVVGEYGFAAAQPRESPSQSLRLIGRVLQPVWGSIQAVGIVLLVLIFVLLEHESLRDRFIRIVGATDIRSATVALNDAGERLSRFFVSQFAVNLAFGTAIWASLSLLHVPQAMLLGTLAGVMRFVPYVGAALAALLSTLFAFAVDPGWSLAAYTLAIFILLDIVVGQLVEPHLYGHATGLSPLSVVVAAIFWSSLWGPIGLILSVPLTLCLVVAGRHIQALGILELLLSDAQALTLPQKFYQRALSGDSLEIITAAREFLKRKSLAEYCDAVVIPALHLARLDADTLPTSEDQQLRIRRVMVEVVAALSSDGLELPRRRYKGSVLDHSTPGHWLRRQREQVSGRWQGPLGVPPGSVVISLGLGSSADDLVAELLARLLLCQKIDARHFSTGELDTGLPAGADPSGVSMVYLISAFPGPERECADAVRRQVRGLFPYAHVVRVFCPGVAALADRSESAGHANHTASSLVQAMQMCTASPRPTGSSS
jgi:predicted PurR-regulated permease PerM